MTRLEGRAIVTHRTAHHDGIAPVAPDEPDHPWACPIPLQDHDACLLKVKEDPVERLQLEVRELLRQLCLDHPGASSAVCAAAMEAVVQLDGVEPAIHDALQHLPNRLKQSDPTVVPPAFWDQNNYAPSSTIVKWMDAGHSC